MIVQPDIQRAIEANRDVWRAHGGDDDAHRYMLTVLGFRDGELQRLAAAEATKWAHLLRVGATVGDVTALVASAIEHAVAAGVRLGTLESGDSPRAGDPSDPRPHA